jgi:hypothetical protein
MVGTVFLLFGQNIFMKKIQILAFIVATGAIMTSCDTEKKDTTTTTGDTVATTVTPPADQAAQYSNTDARTTTITVDKVPATVKTNFTAKYPKAQDIVWMEYLPAESDNLVMDDTYYYVRFNDNGADYFTWYDNKGEWVKTSTKIEGNANLPEAVNKTINEQYPGYTIEEINKENDKNADMYEIKLNKGDQKVKVKILPNGEIFKSK